RVRRLHDSLEQIANRLGCSLSTVKRHLRKARQTERSQEGGVASMLDLPSLDEVFDAFEEIVESQHARPTG
ncbi:MAG: sigma factor-like helix-turn-helix DNA-binding protein, partial [Nocardioidaceae bacterium]